MNQNRVKELLTYCSDTGVFTWCKTNKVAGCLAADGYYVIQIDKKQYRAHQIAWLYVHGEFLVRQIDHINRRRADNRIINLRKVTLSQNSQNQWLTTKNTSGFRGVCFETKRNKWRAEICINRKRMFLGHYDLCDEAAHAYAKAAAKYHSHNPFAEIK